MTTPHDASASAADNERLQQIRERAAWRKQLIDPIGLRRVDHSDEDFLLDELDHRDRDNARLRDQLAAATGALGDIASKAERHIEMWYISRYIEAWQEVRDIAKANRRRECGSGERGVTAMGHRIVKQPNGLYAIWSTVVDNFVMYNVTAEDIIREEQVEMHEQIAKRVRDTIARLESGAAGDTAFEECIETATVIHGANDETLLKVLQAAASPSTGEPGSGADE